MGEKVYVAVDIGAESGRVIAGVFNGNRLRLERVHRFANGPLRIAESLHWDIEKLYSDVKMGLAMAVSSYGDAIQSVGIDTWGVDYGLLDVNDALVHSPYHYRDPRTDGVMRNTLDRVGASEIYNRTGIQFLPFNTIYQLLAERENDENIWRKARSLLFIPDLLNYWLTGKKFCEQTIASTAQLLNPRDRDWDAHLLRECKIPLSVFAPLKAPGERIGNTTDAVAKQIGKSIPVVSVASHDTGSAIAGTPLVDRETSAYLSSGTWSLLGIESATPVISEATERLSLTNEWGLESTFRVLKNIAGLWIIQECKRSWELGAEALDYAGIASWAEDAPPFSAVLDVDAFGMSVSGSMPAKIESYCQSTHQRPPRTRGETVRIALEGLALKYALTLQSITAATKRSVKQLHIVGGGTKNKLLNQMTADACGIPVFVGPEEGTAAGNIVAQMIACGTIPSMRDGREIIARSFPIETVPPKNTEAWKAPLEKLKELSRIVAASG